MQLELFFGKMVEGYLLKVTQVNYNKKFLNIVKDILENEEFNKLKSIKHHDTNRYDHSLRVSYYSYLITKDLGLNYKSVARAALLHDFFLEENYKEKISKRLDTLLKHPKFALETASKYYDLSDLEKDIIVSHMYPVTLNPPKYLESWIVDFVDDVVALYEKYDSFVFKLSTIKNFLFLVLLKGLN